MYKKILYFFLLFPMLMLCSCASYEYENQYSFNDDFSLKSFEDRLTSIASQCANAVLQVECLTNENEEVFGSCVVYKTMGLIDGEGQEEVRRNADYSQYIHYAITNGHVVEDAASCSVYVEQDNAVYKAELLGIDNKVDVAVLCFTSDNYLRPLTIENSQTVKKGSFCVTLGSPQALYGSITLGIVSHPSRYISNETKGETEEYFECEYIQTDAAINPGNSGGALLNLEGKLIGINTFKFAQIEIDNIGFAISSNTISKLIPYLERGVVPNRVSVDIGYSDVLEKKVFLDGYEYGLYVQKIKIYSTLYNLGLRPKDVIVEINDTKLSYYYQIYGILGNMFIGSNEELKIKVIRSDEIITLSSYI